MPKTSLGLLDRLELQRVHLIGETVGGSIAMQFATSHQDRLLSLAVCTSPVTFDAHHTETADMIDREGIAAWVEHTIGRRLDPQLVAPAYIRWYAAQMAATPAHVVSEFQRRAPGGDLRPLLPSVKTPTLVMAAARLREEVLGDFRSVADLFPNGRSVVFPGVSGFVQHVLPVPCARAWLDFAASLGHASHP